MSIKIEVNPTSSFCYFLISKLLLKHQYHFLAEDGVPVLLKEKKYPQKL